MVATTTVAATGSGGDAIGPGDGGGGKRKAGQDERPSKRRRVSQSATGDLQQVGTLTDPNFAAPTGQAGTAASAAAKREFQDLSRQLDAFAENFTAAMKRAKEARQTHQSERYQVALDEMRAKLDESFTAAHKFFDRYKLSTGKHTRKLAVHLCKHACRVWAAMLRRKFVEELPFRKSGSRGSHSGWFQADALVHESTKCAGQCLPEKGIEGMPLGLEGILPTEEDFAPALILASVLRIKNDEAAENAKKARGHYDDARVHSLMFEALFSKFKLSCEQFTGQERVLWHTNLYAALADELYGIQALDDVLRPNGNALQWPDAQLRSNTKKARNKKKASGKRKKASLEATTASTATTRATTTTTTTMTTTTTDWPSLPSTPAECPISPFHYSELDWTIMDEFDGASN